MSTRDRRDLPERLRDIASTLERHGWLRDKGECPVYWVEKAADEITHLERERDDLRKALELLAVLGEQGMQRDYQRWLTFHDKVSEIARDALRSPEDK